MTRRGSMLLGGSVVLLIAGRVLAMVELYMLAAAALALVAAAVAQVRAARFTVVARREVRPPRVHAGAASRVELAVENLAARRSPVLSARDPFGDGRRAASFLVAPLDPGETARAAYRLPTEHRGVFDLGPLELRRSDPFGLAEATAEAAPATALVVFPHIDPIEAPAFTRGHDPHAGADHPSALGVAGEDFYGLREYTHGDDLRRVHWKATARLDELMIRQDEMPWQGRATVVLDLRQRVHSAVSIEVAVSAAASLVTACARRRSLVRLVAPGADSGFGAGPAHVDAILERLALAAPGPASHLRPLLDPLHRDGDGGALTVITTAAASAADLDTVARLQARFGGVTLVLLEQSVIDPAGAATGSSPAPPSIPPAIPTVASVVRVTSERPFAAAWAARHTTTAARAR
ncbi:MAG: DUF58 domain-containing protein [Acidimicrobiales bacterium]